MFNHMLQVGVSSVWFEGNPCNMHLLDLAKEVIAWLTTDANSRAAVIESPIILQ